MKFRRMVRMSPRVTPQPQVIPLDDPRYPARLRQRLGAHAPPELTALGNLDLLSSP